MRAVAGEANGFRLVGGSGPRGRLEIATTAAWVVGPDAPAGTVAWRPLCYDVSFTNDVARVGYRKGRGYRASGAVEQGLRAVKGLKGQDAEPNGWTWNQRAE